LCYIPAKGYNVNMPRISWIGIVLAATGLLSGCGGGGGNPGNCLGSDQVCGRNFVTQQSVSRVSNAGGGAIPSSTSLENQCSIDKQQQFTRSYLNETYLWYNEVPNIAAGSFSTVKDHFYASLTPLRDSTGALKDRFSFIAPLAEADTLTTGANVGYGADWVRDSAGVIRVTQVAPGSPAALAGLARGGQFIRLINTNTNTSTGNPLFPNAAGAFLTFVYRSTPSSAEQTITLNAVPQVDDPVPQNRVITTTSGKRVGYIQFDAHTQGAQDKLIDTILELQPARLDTMVLDLRYNGGGFLYTALALATMLSGPSTENKVFERLQFNDKRAAESADSVYFYKGALQRGEQSYPLNYSLPRLALPKVYVLTTGNTCSASEAVINGLRGVDIEVVLVGGTTCGKPYGFTRKDNCDSAYFPIEFVGVNDKGFGDYSHGFAANCPAGDDLDNPLGSTSERLLATALGHVETGACPATASAKTTIGLTNRKARMASDGLTDVSRPKMPGRLLSTRP
jgi:carboxyl-terminal processing protease